VIRRAVLSVLVLVSLTLVAAPTSGSQPGADRGTLVVKSSRFGRILFDGRGYVLYGFTADGRNRSNCRGECAAAWPPLIVASRPKAGPGAAARLLGTTRRRGGRLQATYAGKPLYYYVGDRRPGQILCQDVREFGGLWLVIRPSGAFVR
jgi:predicted lipoprotein with Yx(FWY)xxD motif